MWTGGNSRLYWIYIRNGDTVYVAEFSRLGRSTLDLLEIVKIIEEKEARLNSLKETFDTLTSSGRLQLTMLAEMPSLNVYIESFLDAL